MQALSVFSFYGQAERLTSSEISVKRTAATKDFFFNLDLQYME